MGAMYASFAAMSLQAKLGLMAFGTMAVGQIYAGEAARTQAENEAAIAEYNAQVAEQEAKQVEARSAFESMRQAEAAARIQGLLVANLGITGAVMTEGAPLLLRARQEVELELENILIGYEGRTGASRARSQAALYGMEAGAATQRGRAARTASYIGAGSTLLMGFSQFGGGGGGGGGGVAAGRTPSGGFVFEPGTISGRTPSGGFIFGGG
jgi:hypothetical protein